MTDTQATHEDATLSELVKGIRVAVLTTPDSSGELHGRPLTVQRVDEDGTVWFLVDAEADWVTEPTGIANLAFVDDDTWVSAAGTTTLVRDPAVVQDLGDPVSDAWFDEGTTPSALRVDVTRADYWSAPGKVAQVVQLGKAAITRTPPDMGSRGVVRP